MPESLASLLNNRLSQLFSCEFCETSKNTFFHGTPLFSASGEDWPLTLEGS